MEKEQRSKLQKATQEARRLLEEEFSRQLLETYDINVASGRWNEEPGAHLQAEQRLIREKLVAWIEHKKAQIQDQKEALVLGLREMAFTALNRFVALKLMEARELVRPCVSSGLESEGFQEFTAVAQGLLADQEGAYRLYLETIFEDVSRELRALFDPRDPASLLWPKRTALLDLLEILNRPELAELWREDETLGWVYQYFNGDAERKKMRDESSAPRNSRELAVRNQFFTPRYVVEFLTDNTLGRIWYEMRQGKTGLKERCRYLVRRPNEIWLQPGEERPAEVVADEALSQEELLRQPEYIPHRLLKDPREVRMLDPACGSMHFGLYAFDLYLAIYAEAWEIAQGSDELAEQGEAFAPFVTYAAAFANKQAFLSEVPRLILLHNIHGIDIDPRATQIARLTLWLRAQRAWHEQQLEVANRPPITRSNVVCAEPMPGEQKLLADFIDQQFPEAERGLVQQLLEAIFDKMQLAGEAGSLLKIEEEIRDAIDQARREWRKLAVHQQDLFSPSELAALGQVGASLEIDLQNLTKDFWINIEERIYIALSQYAEQSENDGIFQRRLFAEDAAQGFAFIDVCRKRYDATLMNPPFGAYSKRADHVLNRDFSECRGDLYPCFIERWGKRSNKLGAITNRSGLTLSGLAPWRISSLLTSPRLNLLVDLGMGVLDALVETALFVLGEGASELATTLDLLATPKEKAARDIHDACSSIAAGNPIDNCFIRNPDTFREIPGSPICYRIPPGFLNTFLDHVRLEHDGFVVRSTSPNYDDFRFMRLRWEAPSSQLGRKKRWSALAKGGEYRPFYADIELLIDWDDHRKTFRGYTGSVHRPMERPASADLFFRPGITWSGRTASRFSPRILPAGSIFSSKGPFAGGFPNQKLLAQLGIMMSAPFQAFLELFVQAGDATSSGSAARDYQVGSLRSVPDPQLSSDALEIVERRTLEVTRETMLQAANSETSPLFIGWILFKESSLSNALRRFACSRADSVYRILSATRQIDELVANAYGYNKEEWAYTHSLFGLHPLQYPEREILPAAITHVFRQDTDAVIQEAISKGSTGRFITVKGYYADRHLEVVGHILGVSAKMLRDGFIERICSGDAIAQLAEECVSLWAGTAFGRWDIRYATGAQAAPELPDPFAPLPVCPPGQLQSAEGLPARPEDVPAEYPIHIPWNGILVDDPNHPLDIERRVREAIEIIWSGQGGGFTAEAIEHEACEILGVKSLRDYFRKPAGFFAEHLKRYSKSRRQAPIYWHISAGNGTYSAWLYYHRFTQDTLYRVLRDFVEPRIQQAEREQFELESQGALSGDAASRLQEAQSLLQDLRILKTELDLVAPLWNPNLNDGVIINHAILWRITPYTPWQKKCKECWEKLVKGDYDWAHLAFHLWPERVIKKCQSDRSLAIAHGLEERLWQETNKGTWLQRQVSEAELQALIAEHSKPAVQNALERFLAAPPPVAAARTRAPRTAKSTSAGSTRKPRGSATAVDAEASRQTLLVLTAAPAEGLGRNAIADLLDVEAASLTAVIKQLKESGQIEQLGAARGAKYRLTEQGLAAVESQAGEDD